MKRVHALGIIQPKVSRHLATMRDAGIVIDRRQGQWIYYRLNPDLPNWTRLIIETTAAEANQQQSFSNDFAALSTMPNRPDSSCCA